MTKPPSPAVVLLGAQRFDPSLGAAVSELGVTGRIATITAGWQEPRGHPRYPLMGDFFEVRV